MSCWRQIKSSFWIISSTYKPNGSVFLRSTLCLMHLTSKPLHWASDVQLGFLVFVKPVYKISQHWRGSGQVFNSPNFKTKCGHETLAEPHFGCLYESRCLKPMPIKVGLELGTSMSNELHPAYSSPLTAYEKVIQKSYGIIKPRSSCEVKEMCIYS